ncbi:hypothetical protein M422DRAFT_52168 [Sphaerobolus stellatus SS14]|uniref:Uncharacterized protein n=1 Tax=Sphaerobolus stellatus (strain SS14) TaxID=990650 RepID=A0A0C9V9A8_SPHS4|nr:hypothetical protein M422DRAFT_52168 [Sphaerobolus stellatus SS14]
MELEAVIGKLNNLEGLELRWNTEDDCFYIPPCHFTAYIVFTPSSFARLQLWGLSEFSKARSITKTILDIQHSPLHTVNIELLNPFITQMLFYDLECWESLMESCEDPQLKLEIRGWILETRPTLEAVIGEHFSTSQLYNKMRRREESIAAQVARDAADLASSEELSVKDEDDMEVKIEEDTEDIKEEDTEIVKEEDMEYIKEEDMEYIKTEDSASEIVDIMALTDDSEGGC